MATKKINWLEQFAMDYQDTLQKTASLNKEAEQVIVDCAAYPNAKVNSLVDYKGNKYKVISTEYTDTAGPGILLEKLAESNFGSEDPTEDAVISNGTVKATEIEDDSVNCGEPVMKKAAAMEEVELPAVEEKSEYPDTVTKPGGVKPVPSAPLEQDKKVTDPPYHPTFDPGNQYALDIPDNFDDSAEQTANKIAQEDAQDRTTVEGYFTWNKNIILDKIVNDAKDNDESDSLPTSKDMANTDDIDELADFDDSKDAVDESDDVDDEISLDDEDIPEDSEEIDADTDAAADALVEDSEESDMDEDVNDEVNLDDEEFPEDSEEESDEDFELDDSEEEELPEDEEDEKKAEAALNNANRIISRLANLI